MGQNTCYKVLRNDVFGRYLVASRDIKQGEMILKEQPTLIGAPINAFLTCFKCNTILLRNFYPCTECKTAPLCSKSCSGRFHPREECLLMKKCFKLKDFVENSQIIMPLRCLLLRDYKTDIWDEFLRLEPHLEERRDSWIWRNHQINVEQVLLQIGAINEKDLEDNIVQKICGILDVNSFEIRPPNNLISVDSNKKCMRGLFLKAALMAHDCAGNTHLAVDDNFNLTIHASNAINEGEIIFFNYSSALMNTQERREHLREGKYFECTCKRCADPTEFETHLSSLICTRCCVGKVISSQPLSETHKIPWKCNNCEHSFSGSLINSTINECKRHISELDYFSVEGCEKLLTKLLQTFNAQHYLILEVKQNLIAAYSKIVPNKKNLLRRIQLCEDLIDVFEILEPGISRIQAITLYELSNAKLELGQKLFNDQELNEEQYVSHLCGSEEILKKAIGHLIYEPTDSPEGRLCQKALRDLRLLKYNIKQLVRK